MSSVWMVLDLLWGDPGRLSGGCSYVQPNCRGTKGTQRHHQKKSLDLQYKEIPHKSILRTILRDDI